MTCQRCQSLMFNFSIMVSDDAFTQKRISALRCPDCGRSEYGTVVDKSAIQAEDGEPR